MTSPQVLAPTAFGNHLLPDLYVVSWLGMCSPRIDCHVFVLRGRDGLLLIDCGTPWGHELLLKNMAHFGLEIADVRTILLTHAHVDHVAGGHLFKSRGVRILSHREIVTTVEMQWEAQGILQPNGQSYRIDGHLHDGDLLSLHGYEIRVIASPGHTRECLSFEIEVNGQMCLFSGDLVMGNAQPGWIGDPGHSRPSILTSLRKWSGNGARKFEHLCYGHGVIMHDRGALFEQALKNEAAGVWDRTGGVYARPG
jgi:glyoxylase-like metal-dependent hydrolase (beta-lactamase superfamily II)